MRIATNLLVLSACSEETALAGLTACERDFRVASAVPSTQDSHADLFPAYSSCLSLEEWEAANRKFPAAIGATDDMAYTTTLCMQYPTQLTSTPICQAVRQRAVNAAPALTLPLSSRRAMLGVPLPDGATLVDERLGAGADRFEEYTIGASESAIRTFFQGALPRDGWIRDPYVPAFWEKGPYLITVNVKPGRFTVGGS